MDVSETFTDNVALAVGKDVDRNSDLVTSITPNIQVRGTGAHGRLNFNYAPTQKFYRQESERNDLAHSLLGAGQMELWDRVAFIDGQASISRQRVSSTGPLSASPSGEEANTTQVKVYNVSPFLRHHFGTWVDTESRVTHNSVTNDSGVVQNTTTNSELLRLSSGRRFTTWLWSLQAENLKTANETEPAERRRTADADFTYVLGPKLSLIAGLGYEDVEDPTLLTPPQGMTWRFGFAARPSERTSLRTTYGLRNDTKSIDFLGSHRLSERTTITATYGETIQNSQQLLAQSLANAFDPTGAPIGAIGDNSFGLQDQSFRQKRFQLRANGTRQRNTFDGGVFWEKRTTEATNTTETTFGTDVRLSRNLNQRTTGDITLSWRNRDFGTEDQHVDNEYGALLGLRYQILTDVDARVAYNLTYRKANNADQDLTENAVTFTLSKRF